MLIVIHCWGTEPCQVYNTDVDQPVTPVTALKPHPLSHLAFLSHLDQSPIIAPLPLLSHHNLLLGRSSDCHHSHNYIQHPMIDLILHTQSS